MTIIFKVLVENAWKKEIFSIGFCIFDLIGFRRVCVRAARRKLRPVPKFHLANDDD
jgi:hypothetical protein